VLQLSTHNVHCFAAHESRHSRINPLGAYLYPVNAAPKTPTQNHSDSQFPEDYQQAVRLEGLFARVRSGELAATTEFGLRLLVGSGAPLDPRKGVSLLLEAAERDDPAALAQMATLSGIGFLMPLSWNLALDYLQRAAERDSLWAQSQLLALAQAEARTEVEAIPLSIERWRVLRDSIDVERQWLRRPVRQPICEAPRIRSVEGFTTAEVCRWMIAQAQGRLTPAKMYNGRTTSFSEARTCSDFVFDVTQAGLVLTLIRAKASVLMGLPTVAMESPQIFHYAQGQEIKAHLDLVRSAGSDQPERIATFLLYLNDDYDGGDLEFPRAAIRYRGKTGDAVFFANVDHTGHPDKLSLHAAAPVTCGEKYMFSQWIQDRPFGTVIPAVPSTV
jgi:prolyl 4-hydroxylase